MLNNVCLQCFCVSNMSAGKWRRTFLISGNECFENVCTKGHKIVTAATMKDSGSSGFIGTWSCCKNTVWKDSEKNFRPENSKTSGEELPILTKSYAVVLSAFGREGNIFSMCCNTGDLLRVIYYNSDSSSCLFTDCSTFRNPAYDVTLAERRVGACRLGKKENYVRRRMHLACRITKARLQAHTQNS
jgi:hypothetical protein